MELTDQQWRDITSEFHWIKFQTTNEEKIQIVKEHLRSACSGWWHVSKNDTTIVFELISDKIAFRLWLSDDPLGPSGLDE